MRRGRGQEAQIGGCKNSHGTGREARPGACTWRQAGARPGWPLSFIGCARNGIIFYKSDFSSERPAPRVKGAMSTRLSRPVASRGPLWVRREVGAGGRRVVVGTPGCSSVGRVHVGTTGERSGGDSSFWRCGPRTEWGLEREGPAPGSPGPRRPARDPSCPARPGRPGGTHLGHLGHLGQHAHQFAAFALFIFHEVVGHVIGVRDEGALGPWLRVQDGAVQNPSDIANRHHELCLAGQEVCEGKWAGVRGVVGGAGVEAPREDPRGLRLRLQLGPWSAPPDPAKFRQ